MSGQDRVPKPPRTPTGRPLDPDQQPVGGPRHMKSGPVPGPDQWATYRLVSVAAGSMTGGSSAGWRGSG